MLKKLAKRIFKVFLLIDTFISTREEVQLKIIKIGQYTFFRVHNTDINRNKRIHFE